MNKVIENLGRNIRNASESWHMAKKTFIKEEGQFMPGRSVVDRTDRRAITMQWEDNWLQRGVNHMIGKDDSAIASAVGKAGAGVVNTTGAVVRLPTRVIQFADEGFRQMNGRTALQAKIAEDMHMALEAKASVAVLPPNPTQAQRIAFRKSNGPVVAAEVKKQMETLITNGHLRTREVIVAEAKSTGIVTAEMVDDNSKALTPYIGKPISSIENEVDQALAMYKYIDTNYSAKHHELITHGENEATKAVFQQDPGPIGQAIQKLVDLRDLHTIPRIIMPFVRTPGNILRTWGGYLPTSVLMESLNRLSSVPKAIQNRSFSGAFDINPNGPLRKFHGDTLDDLASGDPTRIADARGRQAVGTTIAVGAYVAASEGGITGGGPHDPNLRKQWMDRGWRPYSVYIPGHGYMSYMRLDPIAPTLALIADTIELMEAEEGKGAHEEKVQVFQALVMSIGSQLSEKTFFQGIGDILKATQDKSGRAADKYMIRLLQSTTQPYSSLQRNLKDIESPEIAEMRTLIDARRKQSWFYDETLAPPSRNVLGEVRLKHTQETLDKGKPYQYVNNLNVLKWSSLSTDPLYIEMAELGVGFASPAENYMNVPLTAFTGGTNDYKYTAYDRWMEKVGEDKMTHMVNGKYVEQTLREHLEMFISEDGIFHDRYLENTGVDPVSGNPKKAEFIRGIITTYTTMARQDMLGFGDPKKSEFPELTRILNEIDKQEESNRIDGIEQTFGVSDHTEQLRDALEMR